MITKLGKELRKLRIDRGLRLYDMAKAIDISTAMLSAVETGRKAAPDDLIARLAAHYSEVAARRDELQQFADLTKKEVRMALDERENATELAVAFARRFSQLTDEQIIHLKETLETGD